MRDREMRDREMRDREMRERDERREMRDREMRKMRERERDDREITQQICSYSRSMQPAMHSACLTSTYCLA